MDIMAKFPNKCTAGDDNVPGFIEPIYEVFLQHVSANLGKLTIKSFAFRCKWKSARVLLISIKGENLDDQGQVNVISTDFSHGFDTVSHILLKISLKLLVLLMDCAC